jgi:ParB/RepB/Spo0J family partition protein
MKTMEVDVKKIKPRSNYSRAEVTDLSGLMMSMKKIGQLQPIGLIPLKNGNYEIEFGFRRWKAASKLGWNTIRAEISSNKKKETTRIINNLAENIQRQNVSLSEEGKVYNTLITKGMTKKEIAIAVGVTVSNVEKTMRLWEHIPNKYRDKIFQTRGPRSEKKKGQIPFATALHCLNLHSKTKVPMGNLLKYASEGNTKSQVSEFARTVKKGGVKSAAKKTIKVRAKSIMVDFKEKELLAWEKKNGRITAAVVELIRNSDLRHLLL